ncbi:histidine phosphatase family protein [Brevibacillus ginsengisoli]|uniref:histidine phosphatase family protein n=1 Tax=Brevibacillus ginsengisoli TaxID=363854 RepID=UPI003CF3B216
METILYFIRHGETDWNKLRRIQGHSDIELNSLGEEQAERLAAHIANHPITAVYSSDLKRARCTAQKLADLVGVPLQTLETLRERNYGEWEGLTMEEIQTQFSYLATDLTVYGIEAFEAMQKRAHQCLSDLALNHPNQTIAAVSHGGLINAFLHYVTLGEQGTGITRIDNTGTSVFRYRGGFWEVVSINAIDHL